MDLTKKLTQLKRGLAAEDVAKNVIVSLQVSEVGPIELRLVYLVSGNASWSPSYGELLRRLSRASKTAFHSVLIVYRCSRVQHRGDAEHYVLRPNPPEHW